MARSIAFRSMSTPVSRQGSILVLLCAVLSALGLFPAAAASAAAPAAGTGLVRMMHLSPDTPSVDLYIDSVSDPDVSVKLAGVGYGDVSAYQSVEPGTYTVSARAAGADASTPAVLSSTVTVRKGTATTIAGVGMFADLGFSVLTDDLSLPPSGQSRARVINAASSGSPLDLSLSGGTTLADQLAFAKQTDYVDVPGGKRTLAISGAASTSDDLPVDLSAGSVYTVLVLDSSKGGLEVQTALDAASPDVVPVGGVETGAGGTAPSPLPVAQLAAAVLAVGALALTVRARLPRRRAARHSAS